MKNRTIFNIRPSKNAGYQKALGKQGGFRIFSLSFHGALSNKSIEIGYDKKPHLGSF